MPNEYRLIDTTKALLEALPTLENADAFFLDTEFKSAREGTTLCLLQISVGKEILLIDMLRLTALERLAEIIGRPDVEWILHSGRTDVELLNEKLHLKELPRLFDTQLAWGLLGPEASVSLGYLIYRILGIRTAKEQQADDWLKRPLGKGQLEYAARDIEHLPELRAELASQLATEGKVDLVHEVGQELFRLEKSEDSCREISMEHFRNIWELDYDGLAAMTYLIDWYNELPPAERAQAPSRQTLFLIARRMPECAEELSSIRGVRHKWARKHDDLLTGRLIRVTSQAKQSDFTSIAPPPYNSFEENRRQATLAYARAIVSEQVAIAPELSFPSWLMDRLAAKLAVTDDLLSVAELFTGWRAEWLAKPYREFCKTHFS